MRELEHGPRSGESIIFLHGANVAGWMWQPQVQGLADRHLITPDLPGYGARVDETWPGLAAVADDVAETVRTHGVGGRAHVVGLSLGGFVATHLAHRHPDLVLSCTITGSALAGYSRLERLIIGAQVPLWRRRWYWAAQAFAFRIPSDSRDLFADDASAVSARSNRAMFAEVGVGAMPTGEVTYAGPFLAVRGERETASVSRAFEPLRAAVPQLRTWTAPRMHHAWNIEDPDLFTRMVATHVDTGSWDGG